MKLTNVIDTKTMLFFASILSVFVINYSFHAGYLVTYGDAESHLNIAKRVVHSITPGFSQLGGIWLPLPHLLMIPFVYFDSLWRTGLAGSILSGISFVISAVFIYKLVLLVTDNKYAALISFLIFSLNPNILYMQTTAMSELPLILFFVTSTYFFIKFLMDQEDIFSLITAALLGLAASLTRYDGWFLVLTQASILIFLYLKRFIQKQDRKILEGQFFLFSTLAFLGIFLWIGWDLLILGDPFYFSNSSFSAKSQQQGWLARGELPTYHNLYLSIIYYSMTALRNIGTILSALFIFGLLIYIANKDFIKRGLIISLFLTPFTFYVATLYMGQSVIFIPDVVPKDFEWHMFNVRYGIMMVPVAAFFTAYLFNRVHLLSKLLIIFLLISQAVSFISGYEKVITWEDGKYGFSSFKSPHVESWIRENYDGGLVLIDDFARTLSIIRSGIPMQNIIYIGNKPYWEESLKEPEKHARWIIMQKSDVVWSTILNDPDTSGRLYKYFEKAYTSPEILVFKRNPNVE